MLSGLLQWVSDAGHLSTYFTFAVLGGLIARYVYGHFGQKPYQDKERFHDENDDKWKTRSVTKHKPSTKSAIYASIPFFGGVAITAIALATAGQVFCNYVSDLYIFTSCDWDMKVPMAFFFAFVGYFAWEIATGIVHSFGAAVTGTFTKRGGIILLLLVGAGLTWFFLNYLAQVPMTPAGDAERTQLAEAATLIIVVMVGLAFLWRKLVPKGAPPSGAKGGGGGAHH